LRGIVYLPTLPIRFRLLNLKVNFAVVRFLKGTFSIVVSVPIGARSLEV